MAGTLIEAKIEDGGIKKQLSAIEARLGDLRPVWALIGQIVLESVQRNFRERRAPDGTPWKPVSKPYAAWKSRRGNDPGNILILKNRLLRSIHPTPAADHVLIGTNVVYAAIHQFGGTIATKGRTQVSPRGKSGKFISRKDAGRKKTGSTRISISDIGPGSITMPARPFLGVRKEDWGRISKALEKYLVGGR